jgi:4,5-dihydroxyphthalate decarboxylase
LAKYASLLASGDTSLTAIPVFPSRVFRHSSIYLRRDSGIQKPADLNGRRIGVPEWVQTAGVYARGILMHEFGLRLQDVDWSQGGINQPGREEQASLSLPEGVSCTPVTDRSLNDMLLAGELDAVITAAPPLSFADGAGPIVRLFADYEAVERDYFTRTRVFPIMHIVALRRDVVDSHPWVAMNLYKAFHLARHASLARASEITASRLPLPWSARRMQEASDLLGELWPYGIQANRTTLETFLQFCKEQGVCERLLQPEELVPAGVQHEFRI